MVKQLTTSQAILSRFQRMVRRLRLVRMGTTAIVLIQATSASIRGMVPRGSSLGQILMVNRLSTIQALPSLFQQMVRLLQLVLPITTAMVIAPVMFGSIRGRVLRGASSGPI